MGNDVCNPVGPEVPGWVILREGDDGFNSDENNNKPYYYHSKYGYFWRRNLMGYGPPNYKGGLAKQG